MCAGLPTSDATLTLTDAPVVLNVGPVFADNTGNAQTWTQGFAISPLTVPAATGTPTPTYAAGALPAGVAFNPTTRVISGDANSGGHRNDHYHVPPTLRARTIGQSITRLRLRPSPLLSLTTLATPKPGRRIRPSLPLRSLKPRAIRCPLMRPLMRLAGIAFNAGTRVISGTPTTAGSGTITVTATNSAGTADWTVAYTIAAAVVLTLRERLEGVASGSGHILLMSPWTTRSRAATQTSTISTSIPRPSAH